VNTELIIDQAPRIKCIVIVEENTLFGDFGNYVNNVCQQLAVSERRVCQVLGQAKATQWLIPSPQSDEKYQRQLKSLLSCLVGRFLLPHPASGD
jgi:hypothetical protein